jgi:hypothetical protein
MIVPIAMPRWQAMAKLRLDFFGLASLCVAMRSDHEHDRRLLLTNLLLEAGRLMEDASPEFAMRLPDRAAGVAARIDILELTAGDLLALATAARALLRGISD